jgi:hypothetical protein
MALDQNQLSQSLKNAFTSAKDNSWSSDQVADAIAAAINTFVLSATVIDVTVDVVDPTNKHIGTGVQTGTGSLK